LRASSQRRREEITPVSQRRLDARRAAGAAWARDRQQALPNSVETSPVVYQRLPG